MATMDDLNEDEIKKRKAELKRRYDSRITIVRQGKEAFTAKNFVVAAKKYNEYLATVAEYKELDSIYKISVTHFPGDENTAERLLIGHVFWELGRIYEVSPELVGQYEKAINQFVRFSLNQPFQYLNSEMVRKYLKKSRAGGAQIAILKTAYNQIYMKSKKCYIATHCFGENDLVTERLRYFKKGLLEYSLGRIFVQYYYRLSPGLVDFFDRHSKLNALFLLGARPGLRILAFIYRKK